MVDTSTEFIADPSGHMLAVVEDRTKAEQAVAALEADGFQEVRLYQGWAGAEAIDAKGTEHGLAEHLLRLVQQGLTNKDSLAEYERAARSGAAVVSHQADGDEARRRASLTILERAGARAINYYGRAVVETLKP